MELLYTDKRIAVAVKPPGVLSTDEPGGMPELLRAQLHTAASAPSTVWTPRPAG